MDPPQGGGRTEVLAEPARRHTSNSEDLDVLQQAKAKYANTKVKLDARRGPQATGSSFMLSGAAGSMVMGILEQKVANAHGSFNAASSMQKNVRCASSRAPQAAPPRHSLNSADYNTSELLPFVPQLVASRARTTGSFEDCRAYD